MQVQQSFRDNSGLTNKEDILKAKQAGITAIGNYYAVQAYEMVQEGRRREPVVPHPLRGDKQ